MSAPAVANVPDGHWPDHVRGAWFAAALSSAVQRRPLAVTLMDAPVVLARLASGNVVAFDDRCPHRQAPLSAGCVVGDTLQCPYHGWRFAADGALQAIPGLPAADADALPLVRLAKWHVREHDGIVWIARSGAGAGDRGGRRSSAPAELPALAREGSPVDRRFVRRELFTAGIVDLLENVLDATHTHFVHAGIVRFDGQRTPMRATLTQTATGFQVEYAGSTRQSGWINRLFEPARSGELAHFDGPGSAQFEYRYANGARATVTLHFMPCTATTTQLVTTLHVRGRWAPAWMVRWFLWPFVKRVVAQDRAMLRLQAGNRVRFPGRGDVRGPLDIVRSRIEAAWAATPPVAAQPGAAPIVTRLDL